MGTKAPAQVEGARQTEGSCRGPTGRGSERVGNKRRHVGGTPTHHTGKSFSFVSKRGLTGSPWRAHTQRRVSKAFSICREAQPSHPERLGLARARLGVGVCVWGGCLEV